MELGAALPVLAQAAVCHDARRQATHILKLSAVGRWRWRMHRRISVIVRWRWRMQRCISAVVRWRWGMHCFIDEHDTYLIEIADGARRQGSHILELSAVVRWRWRMHRRISASVGWRWSRQIDRRNGICSRQ